MKMKLKKGDLVRVKPSAKEAYYWTSEMEYLIDKFVKVDILSNDGKGFTGDVMNGDASWYLEFKDVEPVEKCVEIYQSGNKIIAKNKITGKQEIARCNTKEDTFDFMIGANLALERLEKMETEIQVGDIVKVKDTEKICSTHTALAEKLANSDKDMLARYAYGYSPYSKGIKKLNEEYEVIARDGNNCLIRQCYSSFFGYGKVLVIDVEGLELCERGK